MRSAALYRSLSNSVWFRFDCYVQHYFVSIRKTFIDIFVALTELRKKLLHTLCHEKTKNLFSHEKATQKFLCTKKQRKILFARGLSIQQLPALGCWNVTLLLLRLLRKKCEYHRTCCDYLVATACQDFSAWNERKKLQHFHQLVVNMVWDLWKSYARTFRCLAYPHSDDTHRNIPSLWRHPAESPNPSVFQYKLQDVLRHSRVRISLYHVTAASYC